MKSSRLNGILRVPVVWIFRIVHGVEFLGFPFGIIGDHDFDRMQHREPAQRRLVELVAHRVLERVHVGQRRIFRDSDSVGKIAQHARGHAASAHAGDGRQARIVPAVDESFVDELLELALAHHGVGEIEAREFVLVRQRPRQIERLQDPVVERAVDFELQRANRVGDAFEVIAQAMREIVERINAPLVAGVMMRGVPDAIEDRIAQPHVRRLHVDLGAQGARAVGKFARFHAREQIEVFFDRAIAKRSILAEPAIFVGLSRRHVADVGLAFAHELLERIRRVDRNNRKRKSGVPSPFSPKFLSAQPSISQWMSAMIESTNSVSSFSGLVSSIRTLQMPPNSRAMPKLRQIALVCPMWR